MKSEDVSRSLLFLCGSDGKTSAYSAGNLSSIPGSGRSPEEINGNLLQYSCLENSMDRGAWRAVVHGVVELDINERLSLRFSEYSPANFWCCYYTLKVKERLSLHVFVWVSPGWAFFILRTTVLLDTVNIARIELNIFCVGCRQHYIFKGSLLGSCLSERFMLTPSHCIAGATLSYKE